MRRISSILAAIVVAVCGDQHILLDSTKEIQLDWTRYSQGPQASPGWAEESFTYFEKDIHWRSYVVCDVGYPNVNNWLRTPFIPRSEAHRVYIEIKFSLRNCDLFPGKALQCKETFSLYAFDASSREPPSWENDANSRGEEYVLVDRIAADEGRFTSNNEVIINTETRSIDVSKKGVFFAFRDQGACLSLLAVKVYYLTCPEIVVNFAKFPETPTGKELTSIERVLGVCVDNASFKNDRPFNLCQGDGSWAFNAGSCHCDPGFQANNVTRACESCPIGRYKSEAGNGMLCRICPPHSRSVVPGASHCRCEPGFFRSPTDSPHSGCSRPPSSPQNLTFKFLDPTTVAFAWTPPLEEEGEKGRLDTTYMVTCDVCSDEVKFPKNAFQDTRLVVSDLDFGKTYEFKIYAVNGVSRLSNKEANFTSVTVTTEEETKRNDDRHGGVKLDVDVDEVHSSKVVLSWTFPDLLRERVFEVKYFVRGSERNGSQTIVTRNREAEIDGLLSNTEYGFRVRVKSANAHHWSSFSDPPVYQKTLTNFDSPVIGEAVTVDASLIVGSVAAVLITFVLVSLLLLLIKKGSSRWRTKSADGKDADSLDYRGNNETHPIVVHQTLSSSPIYNPFTTALATTPYKTYVDPHTYEDPQFAVRQFAKEIDARFITIEAIIGGGEFGDVCRGRLSLPDREDMLVAIKTLKPGSSEKSRSDFLTEASIMGQFEHPNVIFLQGVVTKSNPIMIITEYMENGSLDTFLRANDGKFQVMQLIGMMRGIAYGMQYLSEMNYVHRDLAARNVLVNSQLVCKIADFGLSRQISADVENGGGAYTTRGGKIPVRWTAPEAIAFRKFTSASDVWSFGIVMWEIMGYGERPYWTWSNQDVIKAIEKGYRLPAPMDCPEANHQLMLDCWQKERAHRPTFAAIVKTLDKLICCPETLRKVAPDPLQSIYSSGPTNAFQTVDEWLASIKMTRYSENFARAGIREMSDVTKTVTLARLQHEIGVTLVGHQKKIMGSIHAMRAQSSVAEEGFLV